MSLKNTINKHWFRLSQWTKTEVTDQDKYWASHKWTVSLNYYLYNPREVFGTLYEDSGC